jgi:hypothetical protein
MRFSNIAIATLAGIISTGLTSTVLEAGFGGMAWADDRAIADEIAAAPHYGLQPLAGTEAYPVELDLLTPDADLSDRNVITDDMISQQGLTTPSLWWAERQFGGKLLEHWLAYPGSEDSPRRVDVVVDRQLWGLSTYLQRYTFVNQFGTAAKEFGYNLRVFNDQGDPLASYACNFPASQDEQRHAFEEVSEHSDRNHLDPEIDPENFESDDSENLESTASVPFNPDELSCSVTLDSSGAGALRGRSNTFDIFF